ncbi:MAG: response regulator [bacterium]|nr:response regulator [bacterium]
MNKYILIIDDSPTIRISVEFAIKKTGMPAEQAENGIEALDKVKTIKGNGDDLALIICDINMPQMDGITFIKEFRKDDKFTPIVVLTTESEDSKIKEGKEAGASGWIVKPFQPNDLLGVVERFIK